LLSPFATVIVAQNDCGHTTLSESLVAGTAWMLTMRHPCGPRATSKCAANFSISVPSARWRDQITSIAAPSLW
jgi:hypothetical protein